MLAANALHHQWLHWRASQWETAHLSLDTLPIGLWWGASVFTTLRWPLPWAGWWAHHRRLTSSCQQLGLEAPPCPTKTWESFQAVVTPPKGAYVKIRLTGIVASALSQAATPASPSTPLPLVWLACVEPTPLAPWPAQHPPTGQGIVALTHPFSPTWPTHKTGDFWPALHLQRQVLASVAHHTPPPTHVVWQHPTQGYFTEATWANVVWLDDTHTLRFAPQGSVLGGVTQQQWQQATLALRQPLTHEPTLPSTPLLGAWVMNSVRGVQPLARLNQQALPWPASAQRLAQAIYSQWVATSCHALV